MNEKERNKEMEGSKEKVPSPKAFKRNEFKSKHKFLKTDWPDPSKKPYDHPFGPYADTFSELQHKYGPYTAIIEGQSKK